MKILTKKALEISDYELHQPGVIKLMEFMEDRLVKHRLANDSYDADPSLRGRIAEIKYIFKMLNLTKT